MKIFKITNITNTLTKRDVSFNSEIKVEYIDGHHKKELSINPGQTKYLKIAVLPTSAHHLRLKGTIIVSEVSDTDFSSPIRKVSKEKTLSTSKTKKTQPKSKTEIKSTKKSKEEPIIDSIKDTVEETKE